MKNDKKKHFRLILSLLRVRSYISEKYKPIRKRVFVFLTFVVLASFFWFYRALDDTYVEDIRYPVEFINLPNNKILTSKPPKKIVLKVRGDGYTILSKKFYASKLTFDVNNFSLHSQSLDSLSVYLITQKAQESLNKQLITENDLLEIVSIKPDTIFFNFSKTKNKKVAVKPVFQEPDKLFARQHTKNGAIIVTPDSLLITGPARIVDTILHIKTRPLDISELKDTTTVNSKLVPIKGVEYVGKNVRVTIPVDMFTESEFNLPIKVRNSPDSLNIKVFPRTIKINYKVTLSYYNSISETDFEPYVDYNDISKNKNHPSSRIKVYLGSIPKHTLSTTTYPSNVEYLIESNNAKDRDNGWNR